MSVALERRASDSTWTTPAAHCHIAANLYPSQCITPTNPQRFVFHATICWIDSLALLNNPNSMQDIDSPVGILQRGSPAYKKAYRNHQRSVRNQPAKDEVSPLTPFRSAEKKFKARFPPPDLSNVLDLALLDPNRGDEINDGVWKGRADAIESQEIRLTTNSLASSRKAYCVPRIPGKSASALYVRDAQFTILLRLGLVLLPGYLPPETQNELIHWSLHEHARWPNETNLDTHYQMPTEGLWQAHLNALRRSIDEAEPLILPRDPIPGSVSEPAGPRKLISNEPASPLSISDLAAKPKPPPAPSESSGPATATDLLPKLRWANIGWFYHWGTKHYDFSRGKVEIKEPVRSLCKEIVRSINWNDVFALGVSTDSEGDWGEGGPTWNDWRTDYGRDKI